MKFLARVVKGASRGKTLGVPTINVDVNDVPPDLQEGVFACRIRLLPDETWHTGALYYGPRPTFNDTKSCEVHVIDAHVSAPPGEVEIDVGEFIRGVEKFPSAESLSEKMRQDIRRASGILE